MCGFLKKFNLLIKSIKDLTAAINNLVKVLKRPPMPGILKLVAIYEDDMLHFKIVLPNPGASDVVSRELTVAIAGGEPVVQVVDGTVLEVSGFSGNDNDSVSADLVDIDDAGNRSEARHGDFVLLDTIPPPKPDTLAVVVESET